MARQRSRVKWEQLPIEGMAGLAYIAASAVRGRKRKGGRKTKVEMEVNLAAKNEIW